MNVPRISHLKALPKNVGFRDYYMLCRCSADMAHVLQQFEFWDGTKAAGNIHGEQINEQLLAAGKVPTQDVSRFVYKTGEELAWELMYEVSERTITKLLDILVNELGYLKVRSNPYNTFDHTKQYEFQERLIADHLKRLYTIIQYFLDLGRQPRPVIYAIEQLIKDGNAIAPMKRGDDGEFHEDTTKEPLSIQQVMGKLRAMHLQMRKEEQQAREKAKTKVAQPAQETGEDPSPKSVKRQKKEEKTEPALLRFIKADLKKDERNGFGPTSDTPRRFGKFSESNMQEDAASITNNCGMGSEDSQNGFGDFSPTISVITPVITNNERENNSNFPGVNGSLSPPFENSPPDFEADESEPSGKPESLPIANGTTSPEQPPGEPPPEPPKRTVAERVEAIYRCFDRLLQEVTGDPDDCYDRKEKYTEAIIEELLPKKPTSVKMRKVFLAKWNEKDSGTGKYFWRSVMNPAVFAEHYKDWLRAIESEEKPAPTSGASPGLGVSGRPVVRATQPMTVIRPQRTERRKGA